MDELPENSPDKPLYPLFREAIVKRVAARRFSLIIFDSGSGYENRP